MRRVRLGIAGIGMGLIVAGCAPTGMMLVAPTANGKAWVVNHEGKTDTLYLCQATGGHPVCTEQKER
jgi:hypothetical protein